MPNYSYQIDGCAYKIYPTETHFGLFELADGSVTDIFQQYPFGGEWGKTMTDNVNLREEMPLPVLLDIVYLSIVEEKFYCLSLPFNSQELNKIFNQFESVVNDEERMHLIVGMAPYGGIALWLGCMFKQILLGWIYSQEILLAMDDFLPQNPNITLSDYCQDYINNDSRVKENLEKNGLPPRNLFDKYMQQFTYRYLSLFEHWNEDKEEWTKDDDEELMPEFDYVEEALFDGTHDKLHDGGLMNYHLAGKPKKLAVNWHIKKSEYTAYFWFEDEEIRELFDRFYGAHPDTKTDFMIRIDSDKKKFELALFRYGLKEPQVISESAYQLIVFKNKFEYFRSENYNQPRGAWVW